MAARLTATHEYQTDLAKKDFRTFARCWPVLGGSGNMDASDTRPSPTNGVPKASSIPFFQHGRNSAGVQIPHRLLSRHRHWRSQTAEYAVPEASS